MALALSKTELWNSALVRIGETDFIQSDQEQNNPALEICKLRWDENVRRLLEEDDWAFATREVALAEIQSQSVEVSGDGSNLEFDVPKQYLDSDQLTVVFTDSTGADFTLTAVTDFTVENRPGRNQKYITLTSTFTSTYGTPQSDESVTITVAFSREGWDYVYGLPADCIKPRALLHNGTRLSLTRSEERLEYAVMTDDAGEARYLCSNASSSSFAALEYTANITNVSMWSTHIKEALIWKMAMELGAGLRKDPKVAQWCMDHYKNELSAARAFERNYENQRIEPTTESIAARNA